MAQIDDLAAQVTQNTSTEDSAAILINGFAARLDAAVEAAKAGNDAPMAQLQADLKSHGDALAAAVAANTPSA